MLNRNFRTALNESLFSGKLSFNHNGIPNTASMSIPSDKTSNDNLLNKTFKTGTLSNSEMNYIDASTTGGMFLALCSNDDTSYSTAKYNTLGAIEKIGCQNINIIKNNALGVSVVATLSNDGTDEVTVKSVFLSYRMKTLVVPRDRYVCFYDTIFGKVILDKPLTMQPGEQRTFEYQIKF